MVRDVSPSLVVDEALTAALHEDVGHARRTLSAPGHSLLTPATCSLTRPGARSFSSSPRATAVGSTPWPPPTGGVLLLPFSHGRGIELAFRGQQQGPWTETPMSRGGGQRTIHRPHASRINAHGPNRRGMHRRHRTVTSLLVVDAFVSLFLFRAGTNSEAR